jgi:5-(carboxyamino)imidazole ribonucleotide mutase
MPDVGIILGSDSDLPKIKECFAILKEFGISFETIVSSAHRTPRRTVQWASEARSRGIRVIIAAAGGAAHLPGVVAAHTTLPVIGIPIETNVAGGLDSILSIIQMPAGIPVGAMPAGRAGGTNAALYAVSILATTSDEYTRKLEAYRKATEEKIAARNETLQKEGVDSYIRTIEGSK